MNDFMVLLSTWLPMWNCKAVTKPRLKRTNKSDFKDLCEDYRPEVKNKSTNLNESCRTLMGDFVAKLFD